jgi:hypothetical protein
MVHINIHIKDINITFVGITAKYVGEGKIYIYKYTHTILPHSTYIQMFIVISIYMGWGWGDRLCS